MKNKIRIGFLASMALVMLAVVSCSKPQKYAECPLLGHWGCETYISCRTDSTTGYEKWDTLCYEVGEGLGYEVFFYADGSGRLVLNDSPALVKKFNCDYDYDSISGVLTIYNTMWIVSLFTDATSADMDIEEVTESTIVSSWINYFSEPVPFFERFFMKRID